MGVIKVKRIDVRRVVSDACHELISDEKIAEMVYMKIMNPLEDYLDDCEENEELLEELENCGHDFYYNDILRHS